jgi:hypothetical protein
MSGFQHPGEDLLLRFIDGELAGLKRRQIRRHLEACWQCRGTVEELQQTVADCVRYRKEIPTYLPAPPQVWSDLSRGFARIDSEMASEPFWKRLAFPMLKPALAGMAVLALLAAVIYQFQKAPTVKAAVLLQRAIAAESSRTATPHRVRFRTLHKPGVERASTQPMPADIEGLFEEAHYSSDDPLSARSYLQWQTSLESEQDSVDTVSDPLEPSELCYRIHTVPSAGVVADATLLLSKADLHAVEGTLEFRDRNFVEFSELLGSPSGGGNVATHVESPVRPSVPSRSDAVVPGASASISDQVAVYSALHQIGADLGSSVEVSLSGGKVMVGGVGVAPEVQQRVHQQLDSLPNVSVQFSEPRTISADAVDGTTTSGSTAADAQTRLEERLGGHAEFQRFRDAVLKSNENVMDRAYALRTLARTFPVAVESGLSSTDRRMLRDMLRDHLSHLSKQVSEVQSLLQPSLSALGASVQARGVSEGTVWQSSVEDVIRASKLVEVRLSVLLGVTPAQNSTSTQLPSDVLTALADLRAQTEHCTSLVVQ